MHSTQRMFEGNCFVVRLHGLSKGSPNAHFIGEYQKQGSFNGRSMYRFNCPHHLDNREGCPKILWFGGGRWMIGAKAGDPSTSGMFAAGTAENPSALTSSWHVKVGAAFQQNKEVKLHCSGEHPLKLRFALTLKGTQACAELWHFKEWIPPANLNL